MSLIRYTNQEIESSGILHIFTLCNQHMYMQMLLNQPNKQISVLRRATCGKIQKTGITHVRGGRVCTVYTWELYVLRLREFLPAQMAPSFLLPLDGRTRHY